MRLPCYCRAVDRGDLELLKSCYHADGRDDHGFFSGRGWDFAEYVMPTLAQLELSIHSLSNPLIDLHGDKAFVETHWSVIHRLKRNGKVTDLWHQGRYLDEFERRNGQWRILNRVSLLDAERSIDAVNFQSFVPSGKPRRVHAGRRWHFDPVYQLRNVGALIREPFSAPDLWSGYRLLLAFPKFFLHYLGMLIQSRGSKR